MRRALLLMLALVMLPVLLGSHCHTAVVRNATVYETELNFMEQASTQQAEILKAWVGDRCECDEAKEFTDPECKKAADLALTVEARVPWHKAMAMYNAGLLDERPPEDPPEVPESSTLCPDKPLSTRDVTPALDVTWPDGAPPGTGDDDATPDNGGNL